MSIDTHGQNLIIYIIIQNYLVVPNIILLPPLHIKIGIMNIFIKYLDPIGYKMQFPKLSEVKITAGILNCPQIR